MAFVVRTHQTANSPEFQAGLPGAWPQVELAVPDSAALTPEQVAGGWEFWTAETLLQVRATHAAAVTTFYASWPNSQVQKLDRRQQVLDTVADFESALANWATLTVAQQKAVLRRCVQALLWIAKGGRVHFDLD